jgi:adenine-specific DNA-methyltransferase
MKTVSKTSENLSETNLKKLKEVFPQFVQDGIVDFDGLKKFFTDSGMNTTEKYGLSWAGKSDAFKAIRTPSSGTLVPDDKGVGNFDETENIFIEGDNLEVLKLLQKNYQEKIKMIYIDPPYNTGKDFVYKDNFTSGVADYYERTGQTKGGVKMTANTEKNGRYHSDWLTMMYPRLFMARNLLREDGVIFVSIDDNEVANLRLLLDEIFGEENFVAQLIWNKQHSQQQGIFKNYHEYVLLYSKQKIENNIDGGEGEIIAGALKKISKANPASNFTFPVGTRVETDRDFSLIGTYGDSEKVTVVSGKFIVEDSRLKEEVTLYAGWTQKDQMKSWFSGLETIDTKGQEVLEFFFNSEGKLKCKKSRTKITPPTILPSFGMVSEQTEYLKKIMDGNYFDNPKPVEMIKLFGSWFLKNEDIILDFFAGSGTTAHAVMDLNTFDQGSRKWICVQLPEAIDEKIEAYKAGYKTISEISRERISRVAHKYIADKIEKKSKLVTI